MRPRFTLVALASIVAVVAAACGGGDDDAGAGRSDSGGESRTVDVTMVDIGFEPKTLTVAKGDTVTFEFSNDGKLAHDAFIGDEKAQADHEKEMAGDMGAMHHGDDGGITVEPGKTGTITHTFDEPGTTIIGCHQPGHYAAGMRIAVTVD